MRAPGRAAGRAFVAAVLIVGVALVGAGPVAAQGVRGWATSTVRYVQMQPLRLDTAFVEDVVYGEDGVARIDGRRIDCLPTRTLCPYYRPAPVENAVLGSQDIGFTAWGLGLEGLSTTVLVRARDRFSGELDWPIYEDNFDVLVAFAELRRGMFRIRAGRQEATSSLGFAGFDGGSFRVDASAFWGEAFVGRSLARGLNETRREALRGIEDFVLDQEAVLIGGASGFRWTRGDVGVRYQREIWSDRSGLLSERAALDLTTALPWGLRLRSSVDYDLPFARLGKAHLTLQRALGSGRYLLEVEARRYVPYFELSTIWGFFSPVPFHEGRVRLSGGFGPDTGFRVAMAVRNYSDPGTTTVFAPMEDTGYRGEVGFLWSPAERVQVDLGYDLDWGPSAFLHAFDGSVAVDWVPSLRTRVFATSFQQFEAYRLGDGRAFGGGLGVEWILSDRVRLDGMWSLIRQDHGRGADDDVWNQNRATVGLRYEFGSDPGLSRRRR
ncbi:MAG TPA: hypothetical protein VK858_17775 [Longimicrobiales bacterium]|nr:hypothetical protein [Longimicrobiales bacterium]